MLEGGGKFCFYWFFVLFLNTFLRWKGRCKIVSLLTGQTNTITQNALMGKTFYLLEAVPSAHQKVHFLVVVLFEYVSHIPCLFCPK